MMSLGRLAIQSLRYRKLTLILSVSSIALSVILLLGVERIRQQVHESFSSTISGTDLIAGARTGNVSLLLSSVFHIGYANQNVSFESYEHISSLPEEAWSIPLSLGDSHRGYSVLGTTENFFMHFRFGRDQNLTAAAGELSVNNMAAVLGAGVAEELGYRLGDSLVVTHGMGEESFMEHEEEPFTVAGILKPTGTPVDRTIHVSLYAMGAIHEHFYNREEALNALTKMKEESGHEDHSHDHVGEMGETEEIEESPETLTAFMLGLTNPGDILMIQRRINTFEGEAIGVTLGGILAGAILVQLLILTLSPAISGRFGIFMKAGWFSLTEMAMLGIILLRGLLMGILPAYRSYRNSLADGLTIKI